MTNLPEWIERKIEKNRGVKENVTPTVTPVTPVTKDISSCNKKEKSVTANVTLPSHPAVTPTSKEVSSLSTQPDCSTCPGCDKGRDMCHGETYYWGSAVRGIPCRVAKNDCPKTWESKKDRKGR